MTPEAQVWTGRPSQIINLGTYVVCGLVSLTVVGAVVAIPYGFWRFLVIRCQVYELTSQRLKVHSGVLNKKTEELELYRVKDTRFDQPFLLRLFGLGNIEIVSSDSTTPVSCIPAVINGGELREQLRTLVEKRRDEKRVRLAEIE